MIDLKRFESIRQDVAKGRKHIGPHTPRHIRRAVEQVEFLIGMIDALLAELARREDAEAKAAKIEQKPGRRQAALFHDATPRATSDDRQAR